MNETPPPTVLVVDDEAQMQTFVNELSKDKKLLEAFLSRDEKLTDAQADYIRGKAEMYRNSDFHITKLPETVVNVNGANNNTFFDLLLNFER